MLSFLLGIFIYLLSFGSAIKIAGAQPGATKAYELYIPLELQGSQWLVIFVVFSSMGRFWIRVRKSYLAQLMQVETILTINFGFHAIGDALVCFVARDEIHYALRKLAGSLGKLPGLPV